MATRFHIGAKELRGDIAAYAKRFDLLEVAMDPKHPHTIATLRRWRKNVPPHFDFCVVAGPALAKIKPSPALDADLAAALAAVEALQARCLLIQTPADVTPSALWRERITKLLARFPRDATHVIWEPGGVWEVEDAAVAARAWDIVLCVDPSREPVPAGPVSYCRLPSIGETRSYGTAALERVVEAIGPRRDAYVVLETASALAECKALRRLAQGTRTVSPKGGTARILRPRGATVRVGDDEQE